MPEMDIREEELQVRTLSVLVVAACCWLALRPAEATADVYMDLRFNSFYTTDLAHTTPIADPNCVVAKANTNYLIDLWVRVVGTNDANIEGLSYLYPSIKSVQNNGGTVVGYTGAGITSFSRNLYWSGTASTDGNSNTISNDGIQDWGSPTITGQGKSEIFVDSTNTTSPYYAYQINDANYACQYTDYAEFMVGTLTFHTNAVDGALNGSTQLTTVVPTWLLLPNYYLAFPDGTPQSDHADGNSKLHVGNSVYFESAVPEPMTLCLLAAGGVGMLTRRRQNRVADRI